MYIYIYMLHSICACIGQAICPMHAMGNAACPVQAMGNAACPVQAMGNGVHEF